MIAAADPVVLKHLLTGEVYLFVGLLAALILVLFMGLRLFGAVGRVRRESKRAAETARRVQSEWETFNRDQSEAIRQKLVEVDERATTLEQRTAGRIQEFESMVAQTRREIERLENYLRDVFEVELKNAFDSFDSTVSNVLGEMKNELMRGVDRIEEIQALVEGRNAVEGRLADSHDAVGSLTGGDLEVEPAPAPEEGEADASGEPSQGADEEAPPETA